jgi:hypothetical protein
MILIEETYVHPTTEDIIRTKQTLDCVILDSHHIAHRNGTGRYVLTCFTRNKRDASCCSYKRMATGVEYIGCEECGMEMEFKEVE